MTRFLVYLSLLLTGGLSAYSQNPDALPQDTVFRYGFEMSMQKAGLTGVALTRLDNNAISGSIINDSASQPLISPTTYARAKSS